MPPTERQLGGCWLTAEAEEDYWMIVYVLAYISFLFEVLFRS